MALRREPSLEGSVQSQPGVRIEGGWWLLEPLAAGRRGAFWMLAGGGVSISGSLRVFRCRCPQVLSLWVSVSGCSYETVPKFLGLQVLASAPV